jgi:signal transduction histidine kinase
VPRRIDVIPAAALCALGVFSILAGFTDEGPRALTVPVAVIVTVAVAFRRRWPLAVSVVVMSAWGVQSIAAHVPSALWELVVVMLVAYGPGAYAEGRRAIAGLLVNFAGITLITALDPAPDVSFFTPVVFAAGPWVAGRLVRRHWAQARELDALNAELERRRADDLAAATERERARIARELHDVVAHSISVMVVQAGAAEQVVRADPEQTAAALASIRRTGKGALAEMRRMLGVLRAGEPGLAPQPGIDDLSALVDQMRSAGLDAHVRFEGDRAALDPGRELAAYRVVQEALTNTLKHAGAARADVTVRFGPGHVELEVADNGSAVHNGSGGHGLIGMRERMALYGGSVDAGPRDCGGWTVSARIPAGEDAS